MTHLNLSINCLVLITATSALLSTTLSAQESPRERISINADWRFEKEDPADATDTLSYNKIKDWVLPSGNAFMKDPAAQHQRPSGNPGEDVSYVKNSFDDGSWRQLNLPHDWAVEGPFNQDYQGETGKLRYWGPVWYRKHLSIPASDEGRKISIQIDGAMSYSAVWLNGQFVGGWPYGYNSFQLDLTPYIKPGGDNVLAIRLDSPRDSSRWYPGAGIYRNVWLLKTGPIHIGQYGTYITTPEITPRAATVQVQVSVDNQSEAAASTTVKTQVYDGSKLIATAAPQKASVAPSQSAVSSVKVSVPNPKLWDLATPHRYMAVTTVEQNGKVVDRCETPFGIRSIKFTADNGFLLNGKRVPLNGVCDHHDLGALGSAINTRALERQIEILKSMGCNAIRTSHNPPAPELLDLCDRMGVVVMDETFDCWKVKKKPNGYNLVFDDWNEMDVRSFVRRDRNHPCVVLWSIGNEIPEQGRPEGPQMAKRFSTIVHEEDATRPTTFACSDTRGGYNGFQTGVDVFGYNYKPHEYKKFHETHPEIPLVGSETSSCISSRGEYFFPVSNNKGEGKADFQMSSYDLYAPGWATTPDSEFKGQDENPFVAGEFVWTGFDYIGEPTPYSSDTTNLLNWTNPADKAKAEEQLKAMGKIKVPSRSSYFGIIDLAGFKKDRFYLYQARWRPDFPMAHILPHWNWSGREGEITPVHVYTSGDEAELFLNGKSLGRKKKARLEYRLHWDDVKYAPGELKVVAYKNGKKWADDVMKTTGPAAKLKLQPDRAALHADGSDLAFVTVTIADKDGLLVPRSSNLVQFEVTGPAEIVAVDNGDATSLTPFQAKEVKAFNGLALVIIRTQTGKPGAITLKATSEGLTEELANLTSN